MSKVVERALALMECFDERSVTMSLHELSTRAGLAKATTFRLLATLAKAGYVIQLENQDYCLSHKLMRLASVAQRTFSIRDIVRPHMLKIVSITGETLDLSILNGTNRVCIDVLESPKPLKSIIMPGETVPLGLGASGKLLLAYNEKSLLDEVVARRSVNVKREELRKQLSIIRKRGYARTQGERIEGVEAVSVPLREHDSQVRYCLTLTGPIARFAVDGEKHVELMLDMSRTISSYLGASPQQPGQAGLNDVEA